MTTYWRSLAIIAVVAGIAMAQAQARVRHGSPFCNDKGCVATRAALKNICDFIVTEKSDYPVIYIGGYYMRTLVAGYGIFGDRRYLDTATSYADRLLARQMPNGFWTTGYGPVYMADTGSALGLLIALYPHVDPTKQKEYFSAIQHYVTSIQDNNMIHPWGAFGTGWRKTQGNTLQSPIYDQYTLSSALTGGQIFTWMYHQTGQDEYREIAYHALQWIFSTMQSDGNIPHILAMEGMDWDQRNQPEVAKKLWSSHTYGTSAYVGEGIIAFDRYCGDPAMRKWTEQAVKPNIEFLLGHQLANGTWSQMDQRSWDRTRSPGIIDYLIWYYENVHHDPRIVQAVRRYDAFVANPETGKTYGLLNDGAVTGPKDVNYAFNTVTSLTGRALSDILSPGISARW